MAETRWVPLESNPEAMNIFLEKAGVPSSWKLCDVYGLDDDMLGMVPKPVAALILLFPNKEQADRSTEGLDSPKDIYFMKQTVRNACGTVALVHAVGNSTKKITLDSGSFLKKFFSDTKGQSPVERAESFKNNQGLCDAHSAAADKGQTRASSEDKVVPHFVALVEHEGTLYELDGSAGGPIAHGSTSDTSFLKDAAEVCKKFIARDPENLQFNVMALTASV